MGDPWFKFYPSDWRSDPRLRMCGIAARGLWIEMIALMHEAIPYGHLIVSGHSPTDAQLAVLAGTPSDLIPELLGELESAGVFSRTKEGVIYSRKMTRTAKKAAVARRNGKNGGNPSLRKQKEIAASDNQNPTNRVKPQKPEARSQILEAATQLAGESAKSDRYDDLKDQLLKANGIGTGFRDERNPGLLNVGPIIVLIDGGLDLEKDILAAIRAAPNPRARTWAYFVPQIEEYAAKRRGVRERIGTLPPPKEIDWAGRMSVWRKDQTWSPAWGGKPGERDCKVPAEFIEQEHAA